MYNDFIFIERWSQFKFLNLYVSIVGILFAFSFEDGFVKILLMVMCIVSFDSYLLSFYPCNF